MDSGEEVTFSFLYHASKLCFLGVKSGKTQRNRLLLSTKNARINKTKNTLAYYFMIFVRNNFVPYHKRV